MSMHSSAAGTGEPSGPVALPWLPELVPSCFVAPSPYSAATAVTFPCLAASQPGAPPGR
jgi:hypothetical protein